MTTLPLPPLDVFIHNLVALGVVVVSLMLLSQLVVATVLRVSNRFLRSSMFDELTTEDRDGFRRSVRRGTLVAVAIAGAVLLLGALVASFLHLRALDLARLLFAQLSGQDIASLSVRVVKAGGLALGAILIDVLARAITGVVGKALDRSKWFEKRGEALGEVIVHLRAALRAAVLCGAAVAIAGTLGLSEGVQRAVLLVAYVVVAFYTSHLVVRVAHLAVDLVFDLSGKLTRLESPLKYLGNLTHLSGITKRAIDYFVYVGAATWVADELTPGTWLSQAGRVGIRIIAIFYASRVLVELCLLFMNELFLTKAAGQTEEELQQRRTLVPVAVGLLRYGIYFSALVMVLREAEIDPTPLLAGAGVVGVAIGLGAQAFVGDIVAGFFILFENLLLVGDLVEVSDVRGKVEEIGVRITKIRDDSGVLHAIPNGEVRKVSSHSKAYVNAVVDLYVPYEEDQRRVRALLESLTQRFLQEETGKDGPVEIKVQELSEGSVMFRVVARVPPGRDDDLADALRARLLFELRDAGVGAPRARRAVLVDDGGLRIAPPAEPGADKEEGEKQPQLFQPPGGD